MQKLEETLKSQQREPNNLENPPFHANLNQTSLLRSHIDKVYG